MLSWQWKPARACSSSSLSKELVRSCGLRRADVEWHAHAMRQMCWLARPRRRGAPDGPEARTAWGVSTYPFRCAPESSGSVLPVGGGAGLGAVSRAGMSNDVMHESDDAKQSAVLASSSWHACVLLFACCARAHIRVTAATRASCFARGPLSVM